MTHSLDAKGLTQELRDRAEWRAANEGPFTKENLVEWRAAEFLSALPSQEAEAVAKASEFLGRCAFCLDNARVDGSCASMSHDDCIIRRAREAASAPTIAPVAVSVKPLTFEKQNLDGTFWASEVSVAGMYRVKFDGSEWLAMRNDIIIGRVRSSADGIAMCQSNFAERIRSALIPAKPAGVVEAGNALVVQLRAVMHQLNGQAYSSTLSALNSFDAALQGATDGVGL